MTELIRIPGPGDLIGDQFLLDEELGRGGFGIVFKAKQLGVERPVAVKMLLPHAMTHEGVLERFKREARLASSLVHRNSVTIYAYGVHDGGENIKGVPYIAMEYLKGETLQDHLKSRGGSIPLNEATEIVAQALGSLAEAHQKGIIHRDLKPENIFLVQQEGQPTVVKVLDFGIAKAVAGDWDPETRERLTRTGLVAGTAEYMAPEQATGSQDVTPALDVYSMGCILFQLASGEVPYLGASPMDIAIKHISQPIPPLPEHLHGTFVEYVIHKAMAKEPRERFTDASAFQLVLETGEMDRTDLPATLSQGDDEELLDLEDDDEREPGGGPPIGLLFGLAGGAFLLAGVALAAILWPESDPEIPVAVAAEMQPESGEQPVAAGSAEDDSQADDSHLVNTILIDSTPASSVYVGDKKLGETPMLLQRKTLGDDPVKVLLKADKYTDFEADVDWANPPEQSKLSVDLVSLAPVATAEKAKPKAAAKTKAPARKRTATVSAKATTKKRTKKRKASPMLFDLDSSSKKKKQSGSQGDKKKRKPSLFAP